MCKCGRMKDGDCTGIHKLSEEEYREFLFEPVDLWLEWRDNQPKIMREWIEKRIVERKSVQV